MHVVAVINHSIKIYIYILTISYQPEYIYLQMDLSTFISKSGCECLNEADDHPMAHCLTSKGGYLESDCDEQVSTGVSLYCAFFTPTNFYNYLPLS